MSFPASSCAYRCNRKLYAYKFTALRFYQGVVVLRIAGPPELKFQTTGSVGAGQRWQNAYPEQLASTCKP
eukprot:9499403-Pyramimonas_sp.AAC.3